MCTHNSCRSILAEAIARQLSDGKIVVASAGSHPANHVHPLALQYLRAAGYDTVGLTSNSWDDLEHFVQDLTITVCDQAAGETCPAWLDNTSKIHWGLPDPSRVTGNKEEIAAAFYETIKTLEDRIGQLLAHDLESLTKVEIAALQTKSGGTP